MRNPERLSNEHIDNSIGRAAARLLHDRVGLAGPRPEHRLVQAFRLALAAEEGWAVDEHETKYPHLSNWSRPPGGVDIVARIGEELVLGEAKVGKPEEVLWDAIKLADLLTSVPGSRRAYLVYAAPEVTWKRGGPGVELLRPEAPRTWETLDVVAKWPRAWADLLVGGNGIRPRVSASRFEVTPVAQFELSLDGDFTLIVAAISTTVQRFDIDGWPEGFDVPEDLRKRSKGVPVPAVAPVPRAAELDPCHGYPWASHMTLARIAEAIEAVGEDEAAYQCLRGRLSIEKKWSEAELKERVDPLRISTQCPAQLSPTEAAPMIAKSDSELRELRLRRDQDGRIRRLVEDPGPLDPDAEDRLIREFNRARIARREEP